MVSTFCVAHADLKPLIDCRSVQWRKANVGGRCQALQSVRRGIWQKMGRDRYLLEVDSIEVWAIPQRATFQEARNACPSGWRLPTAHCSDLIRLGQADSQSSLRNNELQQLRDYGVFDVLALPDSWFWSSSSHLDGDEFGCYFSGRSGFVTYDLKALVGNVLCIRGLGSATH